MSYLLLNNSFLLVLRKEKAYNNMHNRTNPPRTREDNNLLKTLINVSTYVKTFAYCCKPVISCIFIKAIIFRFNQMQIKIEVYINRKKKLLFSCKIDIIKRNPHNGKLCPIGKMDRHSSFHVIT